jgi:hypothetical protein
MSKFRFLFLIGDFYSHKATMMIETLVSMARYLSARNDDDLADRMNYLYTPNLLLVFSVLISFKQFGGRYV